MRKDLNCQRCGNLIKLIRNDKLQLGQTGWFFGDLPNVISEALEVEIYSCEECGKIEFFRKEEEFEEEFSEDQITQNICPKCRKLHDIDYPKCPFCDYDYCVKRGYFY